MTCQLSCLVEGELQSTEKLYNVILVRASSPLLQFFEIPRPDIFLFTSVLKSLKKNFRNKFSLVKDDKCQGTSILIHNKEPCSRTGIKNRNTFEQNTLN